MAEYEFGVTTIIADLKEQSVFIDFSLDLDPSTVSTYNIFLAVRDENNKNRVVPFDAIVEENTIQLKLNEWAVPNTTYTLLIQPGISSITEETLDSAVVRNFIFKSEVTSTMEIITPADFEKISDDSFTTTFYESGDNKIARYYLEIAKDNGFVDVVIQTIVKAKYKYTTDKLEIGQYYIRVRAQSGDEYGYWSSTKTFIYEAPKKEETDSGDNNGSDVNSGADDNNSNDGSPIIIKDTKLKIVTKPQSGITPASFDIIFDEDIDASNLELTVIRSDF